MLVTPPGRPRTTTSLRSPRGVKVVPKKEDSSHKRVVSSQVSTLQSLRHGRGGEESGPWSAGAAGEKRGHELQQELEQQGVVVLKSETVHSSR